MIILKRCCKVPTALFIITINIQKCKKRFPRIQKKIFQFYQKRDQVENVLKIPKRLEKNACNKPQTNGI